MKTSFLAVALTGLAFSGIASAQAWDFTPHIYARGGYTLSSDFTQRSTNREAFNMGPWSTESNMIADPLTEVTLEAKYGEEFRYFYGFDVENNQRFVTDERKQLSERTNYLEFMRGDFSLWFGSRPYRSDAEYLTRAYTFDEKNLYGGGVRFERLGPVNVEFAYGTYDTSYDLGGATATELTNIFINKLEHPLDNGVIKTNLEVQQTKRQVANGVDDNSTSGYMAGVSYKRWGDKLLEGNLYNQFILHYSSGYLQRHYMVPLFSVTGFDKFADDWEASKLLLQWNGDWKAEKFGLYWAMFYAANDGKDPTGAIEESELKWQTLDAFVRPQYGILPNVTVGAEYARRAVLKEGAGVPAWAANGGAWRWAGMVNYNIDSSYFNNPVISLFVGEVHHDEVKTYFASDSAKSNTHFVRLNYEININ